MRQPLKAAPGVRRRTHSLLSPFAHFVVSVGNPALCRTDNSRVRRLGVGSYSAAGAVVRQKYIWLNLATQLDAHVSSVPGFELPLWKLAE